MDNTKVVLSIGLIVKDEEQYLERCLLSLKCLLEQIPSELIIVDTGSTDHTIEIAKKYTKLVFCYTWCDDFAKARNFALEKAHGEWFMQIDADESFECVESIVNFFNSGDYKNYNDASYTVRSYLNTSETEYVDAYLCRMFKRKPGRVYKGSIHECVPSLGPIKYFDEYVKHFGYLKDSPNGTIKEKTGRNLPLLLEEIKRDCNNPRLLYQLAQEYREQGDKEQAIATCRNTIQARNNADYNFFATYAYDMLSSLYMSKKDYGNAINIAKEYLKRGLPEVPKTLDIIGKMLDSLILLEDYQTAEHVFQDFFRRYLKYKKRIQSGESGIIHSSNVFRPGEEDFRRYQYASVLSKCRKYEEVIENLYQISDKISSKLIVRLSELWSEALEQTGKYRTIVDYYFALLECNSKQNKFIQNIIMNIWEMHIETAYKIASLFPKQNSDEFAKIQNFLLKDYNGETISKEILVSICRDLPTELYNQRVIAIVLKYQESIKPYLERCTFSQVQQLSSIIIQKNPKIRQAVIEHYVVNNSEYSIKELLFMITLKEELLINFKSSLSEYKKLFKTYVEEYYFYLNRYINPHLLNEKTCRNLPEKYCFIVLANLAFQRLERKKIKEFFGYMKEAIQIYPPMNLIVKKVVEDVKREFDEQESARKVFEEYSIKVKQAIKELLERKQIGEAFTIIEAYEKVNPMDPEIKTLKEKASTIH